MASHDECEENIVDVIEFANGNIAIDKHHWKKRTTYSNEDWNEEPKPVALRVFLGPIADEYRHNILNLGIFEAIFYHWC